MQPEEIVPYIMGGIPRGFLKSELNFVFLLYKYLSTIMPTESLKF